MPLKLTDVTQRYDEAREPLFDNFNAEFADGKVCAILGVSGSGKTTLLNVIAGLCKFSGKVDKGNVSYVFQDDRLIDNITVKDNLRLVANSFAANKAEANALVEEYLRLAEIDCHKDKYPDMLSGGERQRVAIARAFMYPSQALLMDEPFNSLDYGVKARLLQQFVKLNQTPRTVVFVTHDADEALAIADEIYILQGKPVTLSLIATLDEPPDKRNVYSSEYVELKQKIIEKL